MKYKYIIYKIYSWTAAKKGDTPIANTVLTLGIVHLAQLFVLYLIVDLLIVPLNWLKHVNKPFLFVSAILYFICFYFLIYNKRRWEGYIEEYKNENDLQRRRGNRMVIAYLIGSILLFFISLPVLLGVSKYLLHR